MFHFPLLLHLSLCVKLFQRSEEIGFYLLFLIGFQIKLLFLDYFHFLKLYHVNLLNKKVFENKNSSYIFKISAFQFFEVVTNFQNH